MAIVAPTMSTRGWSKTPEAIVDSILTYYVSSNPSQSFAYDRSVYSLQSDLERGGGIMANVCMHMSNSLNEVFKRYFPEGAQIECTYNTVSKDSSQININISGEYVSNGIKSTLVKSLLNVNSTFFRAVDVKIV